MELDRRSVRLVSEQKLSHGKANGCFEPVANKTALFVEISTTKQIDEKELEPSKCQRIEIIIRNSTRLHSVKANSTGKLILYHLIYSEYC